MFTLARTLSGVASAGMWSVYIPSLGKTGRVSSANGILDCSGYIGAATANYLFAVIMENVGWDGLVLSWSVVFILGIVITLIRQPNASRQIS
jgi:sugar phosphate permease